MLRRKFVQDYSKDRIKKLKIDEYINGKGDRNTFCNRIETQLKEWGNMKGAFATKFGVYFGAYGKGTNREYRFVRKLGDNVEQAFATLKKELIELIDAGANKNFDSINENLISPMLKGKILSVYYPNDYLNIFSSSHLNFFMEQLNLGLTTGLSEIDKQKIILEFKNSDDLMKSWSVYKFGKFLYYLFGSPTNDKVKGVISKDNNKAMVEIFPEMKNIAYSIVQLHKRNLEDDSYSRIKNSSGKLDYETKNKNNKRLGDRGELIVLQSEINKLKSYGKENLIKKIKHIAKQNDAAGYDILSFDENGNEIYIEVKSTKGKQGDVKFYLTANELERAKDDKNYWIYIVFEANTINPKIWRINNPFENDKDSISLVPIAFRVKLGVDKNSIE